jgi:ribose transport system permease protein
VNGNARRVTVDYGIQIVVLAIVVVALSVFFPAVANVSSIFGVFNQYASVGVVALGLGVTMIAGELDLSVASMATVSGILAIHVASALPTSIGYVGCLVVPVVAGVAFGALQGWLIHLLQINSLVFTIGTLIFLQGFAFVISGSNPVNLTDYTIPDAYSVRWGFLSPSILIAFGVFVVVGLFLSYVRVGREIYAIGGARPEAIAAGVPLRRSLVLSFAISGGCAALSGALVSVKNASGSPLAFGDLLVTAIAAALIGGVSLYGGRGSIWNIALGVAIVSALSTGMLIGGAQPYVATLVTGVILFVVVLIELFRDKLLARSRLRRPGVESAEGVEATAA